MDKIVQTAQDLYNQQINQQNNNQQSQSQNEIQNSQQNQIQEQETLQNLQENLNQQDQQQSQDQDQQDQQQQQQEDDPQLVNQMAEQFQQILEQHMENQQENSNEWIDEDNSEDNSQENSESNYDEESQTNQQDSQQQESSQQENSQQENQDQKIQEVFQKCKHYRRAFHKQCPTCLKFYPCRLCHDDAEYTGAKDYKKAHQLDRQAVTTIKCLKCNEIQDMQQQCVKCEFVFAGYFCKICKFLEYDYKQKKVYHCEKCNICRVGGKEQTYHCDPCGYCMPLFEKNKHICQGNTNKLDKDCPICLENLFVSTKPSTQIRCGHLMHIHCFNKYQQTNIFCPMCKKSLHDIKLLEQMYDPQVKNLKIPDEYKDQDITIFCNDCEKQEKVKFHFYPKCTNCRSYNTTKQ